MHLLIDRSSNHNINNGMNNSNISNCPPRMIEECGGVLMMGGNVNVMDDKRSPPSEPLLSCRVCKKLFAREAYLLRHLETNKEDEQHRLSLIELRKDSEAYFAAARYDSGIMLNEIKMEGDSDMSGVGIGNDTGRRCGSRCGVNALTEERSSISNGVDESYRASTSSSELQNVDEGTGNIMRSRSNSPMPSNSNNHQHHQHQQNRLTPSQHLQPPPQQTHVEEYMHGHNNKNRCISNAEDQQQPQPNGHSQNILAVTSSSASSNSSGDHEIFSPTTSSTTVAVQQQSNLQNNSPMDRNGNNNGQQQTLQQRFYPSDNIQQRFDACRGESLPFSATPGPLYYSLSHHHHGQAAFFGGRRRSNEAEQVYRRRSDVMNPFSSIDFSSGPRDFMGRDFMGRELIGRDTMTPFYTPPIMERPANLNNGSGGGGGGGGGVGGVNEEGMFSGVGGMGGMFDASTAGRLISGLR
ncbi:hypothetical protein HELRODRAFT_169250 [Helobdella robusta]|uniref:C2H2-type domain-containing protein n=1 Tax=Helobdella robusta TaxID=6412 RepID=T1F1M8_HELRO|nr:hypothetical protein HELRODRAFT_169250 [Helobdella robusta]ESO08412.1 hypothetical protein HELRODRAFT_169250 [Helobdella robusta]